MVRWALVILVATCWSFGGQSEPAAPATQESKASTSGNEELRDELERLRKAVQTLEQKVNRQEKQAQEAKRSQPSLADLSEEVKELDQRVSASEREQSLDRMKITGDYRFEGHTIRGNIPDHYDGMELQNLVVKTMFAMPVLGRAPMSVDELDRTINANFAAYQQFSNNLTFDRLKAAMGAFPADMQQRLFGMLTPATGRSAYSANNGILYTNRLRLRIDSKVSDNIRFSGRLSMYKVFGDSTGVQVFNGQPNTLNTDGTTAGVPNGDQLRVERAYFSWNNVGGSKFYFSAGRRPSTGGPPMNFREDEPRNGTPSGALIDYQFDGITLGYNFSDNMVWRLCYGVGYEAGFGNGNLMRSPQDRLRDVHLLGANMDFWTTEKTLIQGTFAHAFNVTDGFNGLMVLPRNPVTGEMINAPAVIRFTPSANLGAIDLGGLNFSRRVQYFDFYGSANVSVTRPNGQTTPFGGLMSDPFENPRQRLGHMFLAGVRYSFANDERTKIGFEFNRGSQYWFNFAQAADDLIAPKTNTRGSVYEAFLTHRITDRFILKADYIRYDYRFSGSGWHLGAPKRLDSRPMLGFPTYQGASKLSIGLVARF